MKKICSVIIPVVLIVVLNSCAAVYKCGDPKPAKQPAMGKRLESVVNERDRLCTDLAAKEKENDGLKKNLTDLTDQFNILTTKNNDLQKKYETLVNMSLSQTDKLSKALLLKSEELDAKEKLLTEREKTLEEMNKVIARQDSITKSLNNILEMPCWVSILMSYRWKLKMARYMSQCRINYYSNQEALQWKPRAKRH